VKVTSLEQLLQQELQDLYDAEKQLVKALPKVAKAASSDELREAITEHLEVTKGQVERIEQVFEVLGAKAKSTPCAGMKGIISEGQEVIEEDAPDALKDLAVIGAAQRVEHYEMAGYGTARALAERLGNKEAVDLLQETLDEEKEADQKLTELAQSLLQSVDTEAVGTGKHSAARRTSGA
jgi:ferritin-like metal-binding protein YciE